MYDNKLYANGVYGLLKVRWLLKLETPLVIRNGQVIRYSDEKRGNKKNRGLGIQFQWAMSGSDAEHQVAALHFGYEVTKAGVGMYHFVPGSSVRGAFRSWVIDHLVQPEYRKGITPKKKKEDEAADKAQTTLYVDTVKAALTEQSHGYQLVASLFGLAAARGFEDEMAENAGRLRVETERFHSGKIEPIEANGDVRQGEAGPGNAKREMVVRNPVDRVTHASKDGGLHQFLQFCKGETFAVTLSVRNPTDSDLGLLSLWRREMEDGLLRIGALSSIGRGRVCVEKETCQLWMRPGATGVSMQRFKVVADKEKQQDVLAGIWQEYELAGESMAEFESALLEHVGGNHGRPLS